MTANPVRPARHFPGKGAAAAQDSGSDSDDSASEDEDEVSTKQQQQQKQQAASAPKVTSFPKGAAQIASNLKAVDLNAQKKQTINEDEFETEESEDDDEDEDEDGSGSEEEDSEEEESSSEDEAAARRKLLRPVFMKKGQRDAAAANGASSQKKVEKTEDEIWAEQEARRKEAADAMIQEQIEKDAAARAAGKKNWDDEDTGLEEEIDDTDDLDPESEYAAWKLRELQRIRRDRLKIEEQEAEIAERERRKNLTAEEREKEDQERLDREKEERGEKGQANYMQKYFHKGAFFQDDEIAAELAKRSIMGAKFADESNKELLPEYMRIRDMTKLGKKGRTRYRDMKAEDTGRWGELGYSNFKKRDGGDDYRGLDDRFQPDHRNDRDQERGATGANASSIGERKRFGDDKEHGHGRDTKRQRVYDD